MRRSTAVLLFTGAAAVAAGVVTGDLSRRAGAPHTEKLGAVGLAGLGVLVLVVAGLTSWRRRRTRRRAEATAHEQLGELIAWPRAERRQVVIRDHRRRRGATADAVSSVTTAGAATAMAPARPDLTSTQAWNPSPWAPPMSLPDHDSGEGDLLRSARYLNADRSFPRL